MSTAYAPGKSILFGEHAVVYGRPAIAVPIRQVRAQATVQAGKTGKGVFLSAPNMNWECYLTESPKGHPLRAIVMNTLSYLRVSAEPDIIVRVDSTIPIACGLGSGTAVSVAIVRALAEYFGIQLPREAVSELAFEVEKIHHGTPSGIDNTVIAYERPVYFVKGQTPVILIPARSFQLIVADTGVCSPTRAVVADVRSKWECDPRQYSSLFDEIGEVSWAARQSIESGRTNDLGPLMNRNQELLRAVGVSSPELERLIEAALQAGASGAKLSGAGRGGNMIALVTEETAPRVEKALRASGAAHVIVTEVASGTTDIHSADGT